MIQGRAGRLWRTIRPLRLRQVTGQLRQRLRGDVRPISVSQAPRSALTASAAPFLGAPAHARGDGWRRFQLLNREVVFADRPDWDFASEGPLFAYHLHQFDWARQASLAPALRRAVMLDWIERHPDGLGWDAGPSSLRAANWIKLLLSPGALALDPEQDARVRVSLASQLETLAANLETHLLANHYLSNLLTLVLAGLVFDGPQARAWRGLERTLRAELAEQIGPDGAHYERSPMYHALMLESVLDVLNVCLAAESNAPAGLAATLEDCASRMLGALAVLTHPDGEIALFGDAAFGIAQSPGALAGYARALGVLPRGPSRPGVLDAAGFVRLERGPFSLLASVAGPRPAYQPGHAHCDALAIELCILGERVVTDTGVYEYVPGRLRDSSRATRSHATLEVDGQEQAECWGAHRVGGRPRVALVAAEPGRRFEASCVGWATPGTVHRRSAELTEDALHIHDALEGRTLPVRQQLPLAPGLSPRLERGPAGARARLRLRSGAWLRIDLPASLEWRIESAPYFPEFGLALERRVLVGRAERFTQGRVVFTLARDGLPARTDRGAP